MAVGTTTALVLAGLAAAGSAYNTNQVAKKQDAVAADGIRAQSKNQREASARVNKTLQDIKASNPADEQKSTQDAYLAQVQRKLGMARQGFAQRGLNSDYDQLAGQEQQNMGDYAGTVANLMSRIDAGSLQRQNEGNIMSNTGMDLDLTRRNIGGDEFLTSLMMKGVRRNPWIDAGAGVASGVATGGLGG